MGWVLLALLPGAGVLVWLFGVGVLLNITAALTAGVAAEAAALRLRGRPVAPALTDGSTPLAALIIGIALPPLLPFWIPALAGALAVLLGKQVYGGLGQNIFNPAMVGYLAVVLAFPQAVSLWPAPETGVGAAVPATEALHYFLTGALPPIADAMTHATPLDRLATEGFAALPGDGGLWGQTQAAGAWLWLGAALLLGGAGLLALRIVDWRLPVGVLVGTAATAALLQLGDGAPVLFHLLSGATLLVAFFIATDPVSAPREPTARLIYAALIGVVALVIRELGGHPDGFAFAVLMLNATAPLLDYVVRRSAGEAA
ncbi:electron transport complex, RnfABCDGE type, D subunit [Halorhodospira halophila SL1]|uniref:Electron transport complex, RnfABCDGE type, D subunit n=2 Tax=Halorhodospira halophila TaxID=1053 RepID=A1WUZ1_HALHL|nr:electron transport complex, RnfABCDGE type, D subunit [Halorhodospira halophila SL1]MBK1728750.1 hypothetical protein [Halorhodospira halophila]